MVSFRWSPWVKKLRSNYNLNFHIFMKLFQLSRARPLPSLRLTDGKKNKTQTIDIDVETHPWHSSSQDTGTWKSHVQSQDGLHIHTNHITADTNKINKQINNKSYIKGSLLVNKCCILLSNSFVIWYYFCHQMKEWWRMDKEKKAFLNFSLPVLA